MARTATRSAAVVVILAALVAGCTSSPPLPAPEAETTPTAMASTQEPGDLDAGATDVAVADDLPALEDVGSPDYRPATRTEELALQIAKIQKPTLQFTLDALDLYQPLPGATPTTLPKGEGLGLGYTLTLVDAAKDRMSPEQRAVVDAFDDERHEIGTITATGEIIPAAGESDDATTTTAAGTDGSTAPATEATSPGATEGTDTTAPTASTTAPGFRAPGRSAPLPRDERSKLLHTEQVLRDVMTSWQAYRPDLPHPAVQFSWSNTSISEQEMTSSRPSTTTPGLVEITMYNDLWNSSISWKDIEFIFAAEYFRAMQYTWSSGLTAQSPWVVQGSSEWAAYDLYRNYYAPDTSRTYAGWFKDQATPLGARLGSAWPLFESLHQFGRDPYPAIKTLLGTGADSVPNLLRAAGLDGLPFASFRSSQAVRRTAKLTPEFFMDWPGPAIAFGPQDNFFTADAHGRGTFTVFGGADYSHPQWAIPFADDVDTVTIAPEDTVTTLTEDGTISIVPGERITLCVKKGACQCPEGSSDSLPVATLPLVISLPEQIKTPYTVLTSDRFKTSDCRKTPRKARAIGDPHLVTFDGAPYDLTLPGEYVLLRDPETRAQVQVRVQAKGWMAAIAISGGDGHRLTFTAPADQEGAPLLQVDGKPSTDTPTTVGSRLQATRQGDDWRLDGPDGLTIGIHWNQGFNVTAIAGKPSAGRLEGLLGNGNGMMYDDLRFPDGTLDTGAGDDFVSSWWVTDDTTLFDYENGRTTASYRTPPPAIPPLSEAHRASYRDALGTDAIGLEIDMCAFDLSVTGDTATITALYADVVQDRVDDYPVLIDQPDLGDGGSSGTTTGTTAPPAGAVTGDGPALTLSGTFGGNQDAAGGTAEGSLALKAGTVIVARSTGCPAGRNVDISVAARTDAIDNLFSSDRATVCDPQQSETVPPAESTHAPGEAYFLIPADGDYDFTLGGYGGDDDFATTVEIYADPDPEVVPADVFDAKGYTGVLDGIGQAVLAWSKPGSRTIKRTASGDIGDLCVTAIYGPEYGKAGVFAIAGNLCGHRTDQTTNPYSEDGQIPYVIFSRTPGKHSIAITAG